MSSTIIEIKPHRWGWKVFEAPGVEPVFGEASGNQLCAVPRKLSLRRDLCVGFARQVIAQMCSEYRDADYKAPFMFLEAVAQSPAVYV